MKITIGTKRPDWQELSRNIAGAIVICPCTSHLHNFQAVYNHYQQGHFDVPVNIDVPENLTEEINMIKLRLDKLEMKNENL